MVFQQYLNIMRPPKPQEALGDFPPFLGQAPELESLMAAVKGQHSQMMQLLLRRKADVNAQEQTRFSISRFYKAVGCGYYIL